MIEGVDLHLTRVVSYCLVGIWTVDCFAAKGVYTDTEEQALFLKNIVYRSVEYKQANRKCSAFCVRGKMRFGRGT